MRAARMNGFGGPEVFDVVELPGLKPGIGEVLIAVAAAGINRPDVFQRKGNYPAPAGVPADIPGLEISGIVQEVGEGVEDLQVGDAVIALLAGGGYATEAVVPADHCILKPEMLSFEEAAAIPETTYTVWHNLFERGHLAKNERVLIHGGTGGIGTTAIQLAKAFGAEVITTVGSAEKKEIAISLGADLVLNYQEEDFASVLKESGVDVVLDSIGGDYFAKHLDILRPDGRLVHINAVQGAKVELNLLKMMQKRITITGSTLRARDKSFKTQLTRAVVTHVLPLIERGEFKPLIHRGYPLSAVSEAHAYFETADQYGKIVLNMKS